MTARFIISILLVICLLGGCRKDSSTLTPSTARVAPTATPAAAIDAKAGFSSPEAMTKFLEQRWPVAQIQAFCIPERRHNNAYQNLVAGFDGPVVWKGTLHSGTPTGFDKIAWYANTKDGRATMFSLGVYRGEDFWLLEIGSEKSVQRAPDYLPDPHQPWFIGHR